MNRKVHDSWYDVIYKILITFAATAGLVVGISAADYFVDTYNDNRHYEMNITPKN